MHIFLDESGNFTGGKDECFIVGGFATSDQRATAKAFRKWQKTKFADKRLRYRNEVKFSDMRLSNKLRAQTLQHLERQNIRIFYALLKTANIPPEYKKKGSIETGKLYTQLVAHTLGLLLPSTETEFTVMVDHRHLKKMRREEFQETIKANILFELPKGAVVRIDMVDSSTNPNIQIADWICGALYRHHSNRPSGEEFYRILRGSIVKFTEPFKDFWGEVPDNKKSPSER